MKTNEQYEAEIEALGTQIQSALESFQSNIGVLPTVLGQDPQHVYDVLNNQYMATMNDYQTSTLRNADVLQSWEDSLTKIAGVLDDVQSAINAANAPQAATVDPSQPSTTSALQQQIADKVSDIAGTAATVIENQFPGIAVGHSVVKAGVIGVGSYLLLGVLGARGIIRLAGAGAAAYWLSKNAQ